MRIAILGTGSVGSALGGGWAGAGHEIVFGTRDPASSRVAELVGGLGGGARAATAAEAAQQAEVVVLATPWNATESVLAAVGPLDGKILIDCTNPLANDLSGLTHGHDDSGGERVAGWAPGARVVKAFNTTGSNNMADTSYAGVRPWMPVCADDEEARSVTMRLAEELGFEAVDAGPLANSRLTEPLALLWIHLAYARGFGREFAFGVLRRGEGT